MKKHLKKLAKQYPTRELVEKRLDQLIGQELKRPLTSKEEDEFNKLKALSHTFTKN